VRVGIIVTCAVCGFQKKPIGRDAPFNAYYCEDGCPGYRAEPYPGSLWPGETEAQFGYPIGNDGTRSRCDGCGGRGVIGAYEQIDYGVWTGSLVTDQPCPDCGGSGRVADCE